METPPSLNGLETDKNLIRAYLGEILASKKYEEYSKIAEKESLISIRDLFAETSRNEIEHSKLFLKKLKEHKTPRTPVIVDFSITSKDDTIDNLFSSISEERFENDHLYPEFAKIAKQEGFGDVSDLFCQISKIEQFHKLKFQKFFYLLKSGKMFKRDDICIWVCKNCGNIEVGKGPPLKCPVCGHPQGWFEALGDSFIDVFEEEEGEGKKKLI